MITLNNQATSRVLAIRINSKQFLRFLNENKAKFQNIPAKDTL